MAACPIVLDRYSVLRVPVFILLDVRRKLKLVSRGFIAIKITETIIIAKGFALTYSSMPCSTLLVCKNV